jgi:hypothetical protein
MPPKPSVLPEHFAEVYRRFQASISRHDCGRRCAPLNGGSPICCSTGNAVPVVHRSEWKLLKSRSDLWHPFKPYDASTREIVSSLHHSNCAIECKGAAFCERDNRSLACRAFPFFPYIDRKGDFIGLSYYWDFEDRCWVISNMQIVESGFLREFVDAFEYLFSVDPEEYDTYKKHSAAMRRVFTRRRKPIALIGREGGFFKIMPKTAKLVPITAAQLPKFGPYRSERAYARAVREAEGLLPDEIELVADAAE